MSENHASLHIHTQMTPEAEPIAATTRPTRNLKAGRRRAASRGRPRAGFGDRLLRNSAIACAALLGVLALGNVDQPWAKQAAQGIERALTMHINLDDSIGELTFVRQIMPESALVFLNVSGGAALTRPVDGAAQHPWSELQPWMMFACEDGAPVFAAEAGTVTAVSPLSGGRFGVLIDHGEGLETVYANLTEAAVSSGDQVARGQQLGSGAGSLYFELRSGGEPIDPTERLGL